MAERRQRQRSDIARDERAVTPAIGKSLEVGLVVLFAGLLTTVLLGGLVPEYRSAAGASLGDRVLATASQEVETAVPPTGRHVDARHRVDLPSSIGGHGYDVSVDGRTLVLEHPDPAIAGRIPLALPSAVDRIEGRWQSGAETVVHVHGDSAGLVVELTNDGDS